MERIHGFLILQNHVILILHLKRMNQLYSKRQEEIKIVLVLVIVIIQHQPTSIFKFHQEDQQGQDTTFVVAGMIGQEARPPTI